MSFPKGRGWGGGAQPSGRDLGFLSSPQPSNPWVAQRVWGLSLEERTWRGEPVSFCILLKAFSCILQNPGCFGAETQRARVCHASQAIRQRGKAGAKAWRFEAAYLGLKVNLMVQGVVKVGTVRGQSRTSAKKVLKDLDLTLGAIGSHGRV